MSASTPHIEPGSARALRAEVPAARIAALADPGSAHFLPPAGASPHLARYGIATHDDDGVVTARVRIHVASVLLAAQDERYLAGSVGERHGQEIGRAHV